MAQREWVEKDFYKELGVSSDASEDEIKRVARRLLAENHPDRNPNNPAAEDRYKAVSEAKDVLTDPAKRKEYDETRRLFAEGGFGRRFSGGNFGGFGTGGNGTEFNLNDLFDSAGQTGGANIGDLFGGLFGRRCATAAQSSASRQRPGNRDRARLPRGHQGRSDAAAAHQPRTVHELSWQRCAPGHQPEGVQHVQRLGRDQPQPGRVRVLRTVHRLPRHRLDHRAPLPRVQRHRGGDPHPHDQRPDTPGRAGRAAHPVARSGRGGVARARRRATCTSPCMCVRTRCSVVTAMT